MDNEITTTAASANASAADTPAEARIRVQTMEESLDVMFRDDGTGDVHEGRGEPEGFSHGVGASVAAAKQGDTAALDALDDAFWADVNPTLDDPWLREDDLADAPIQVAHGSVAELEALLRDALAADRGPTWDEFEEAHVSIEAGTEEEAAGLAEHQDNDGEANDMLTESTRTVITALLDHFEPTGWTWDYNDGAHAQRSGFDMQPERIVETTTRPTASQRAEAVGRLLAWATAHGYADMLKALGAPPGAATGT